MKVPNKYPPNHFLFLHFLGIYFSPLNQQINFSLRLFIDWFIIKFSKTWNAIDWAKTVKFAQYFKKKFGGIINFSQECEKIYSRTFREGIFLYFFPFIFLIQCKGLIHLRIERFFVWFSSLNNTFCADQYF